ncbi:MaoC/PaaZ C-terminal domain-containing protein [Bacillus sp. KH172YL63]|uniref:MaoC/PaaZ C-terminal domain-containing protein n=1 Tax=Bacillus sp. KH172YL63 TaxID=2709784 RepID=UPI0013E49878|nr:MaoC/PaaZ C-terminal domain-containing protein [Bacillus sp. KH172YL63]BCB03815.1 hypothetical protein KH172YL63_19480 [Bacillus sp. KH172YL63]
MRNLRTYQKGDRLPPLELGPVSLEDLISYSKASGDHNPIHVNEEVALNLGLPGIIAHGMWTMGTASRLFSAHSEEGFIQDYSVRFTGMVLLGDNITLLAELTDIRENCLSFSLLAINQHDKKVLEGSIVYSLFQ